MKHSALALVLLALPACILSRSLARPSLELPSCAACANGVALVSRMLPDAEGLRATMDHQICPMTADPDTCRRKSAAVLPVLAIRARQALTAAELCSKAARCHGGVASPMEELVLRGHQAEQRPLGDGPTCAMCTFIVNQAKGYLNDTGVQQTILEALNKACAALPGDFSDSCSVFINTYEPILLQWLETTDSATMCMLVGACLLADAPAPPSPPPLPLSLVRPLASLGSSDALQGMPNAACDICKLVVVEAHSLVSNPDVQATIVNYTKSLCSYAGGPFTLECNDLVDSYAPTAFSFLEGLLSPDDLCAQLGVCKASLFEAWSTQKQTIKSKLWAAHQQQLRADKSTQTEEDA